MPLHIAALLASAYEWYIANPAMDRLLANMPTLEDMRHMLLAGLDASLSDVLEIGPGTGLNLPHYPRHIKHVDTLAPHATVPEALMAKATDRGLSVRHHTYLTLPAARSQGLLSATDADRTCALAKALADLLGVPAADRLDPETHACIMPFATHARAAIVCTLVLCTIPVPALPWYLAELVRVLDPIHGRYFFLEHVVDGEPERKSAIWRALQTVQRHVACGCDIGRHSLDALQMVLAVEDCKWYYDERMWVRASIGLIAYGVARPYAAVDAGTARAVCDVACAAEEHANALVELATPEHPALFVLPRPLPKRWRNLPGLDDDENEDDGATLDLRVRGPTAPGYPAIEYPDPTALLGRDQCCSSAAL
ncbi:hypothetical protein GGF32_007838 [Allomyces javanicus]|nr:hypothetical protein GGF32_007838 [Allomyces javanicus]